jgi:transposase-like protein
VINKAAYVILGINLNGNKEILGIWVGENESAKYWLSVLTALKNRGVRDILIAAIDGLTGFKDAIKVFYLIQKFSVVLFTKYETQQNISHIKIRRSFVVI